MSNTVKSIFFTLALCLLCGSLLAGASKGLKDRQWENMMTDRRKNILKSVWLVNDEKQYTSDKINANTGRKDFSDIPLYSIRRIDSVLYHSD